ncbi:RlpA-like double-psi beta-barrel-protein domain-containing protein-containing protein [Haematococcus lacustris]
MPQLRSPCDAPERSEWPLSSGRLVHPRPLSQSSPASIFALLTLLLAVPASAQWKVGRATWYDDAAWMSVHSGSCMYGYLGNKFGGNQNWMVAAMNDGHPRFGGSCGRCYKIRCKPMTVRDNYGQQIDRNHECYNQDPVTVVITDNCPCHYPNNAYSNKRWCCGDMDHFDLGIWAFKKFADPGKGVVGIEYHETPCPADFQQPLNPSVQKPRVVLSFPNTFTPPKVRASVGGS